MDMQRLKNLCGTSPDIVAVALDSILTAPQKDQLEAALFPPPSKQDKKKFLEDARKHVKNCGIAEGSAIIVALDSAIAEQSKP